MNCPNCNTVVTPTWNVCPQCGYRPTKCANSNCQTWLPQTAKFCPNCGTPTEGRQNHTAAPANSPANAPASKQTIPPQSFKANYFIGSISLGGMLHLEDERAVFKAHAFNIGDTSDKIIPVADICGYKKGMLTILYIFLRSGQEIKLAVWEKDTIINALEARRQQYYRNHGQEAPRLTR